MENETPSLKVAFGVIAGICLPIVLFNSCVLISSGHRGVVTRMGAVQARVMGEGLNFKTPFVEGVHEIEVRTQKETAQAVAYSKDLQQVNVDIAVNFHIQPEQVNKLFQEVGSDWKERIIDPALQESTKSATAQFTAQELVSERHKLKDAIYAALNERLAPRYIMVEEFSITNYDFNDSYEHAIEEKQVAQQNALKAENDLRKIEVEAQQKIATAKADAEAIRIQAAAITQQGGEEFVRLKAVEKWNGILPTQMVPGGTVPFLTLNK